MSPLPQRKKSPEELQQLRDKLGIQQQPAASTPRAPEPAKPAAPTPEEIERARQEAAAKRARFERRATRSLRRSDWDPPKPKVGTPMKSESVGAIPARRRSNEELEDLRRREALSQLSATAPPNLLPKLASPFLLAPAYLMAFFGAACHYWKMIPLAATAGSGAGALLIAGWIYLFRKPSRHHSALLSMITLLALSFAALHYFPDLRHAP